LELLFVEMLNALKWHVILTGLSSPRFPLRLGHVQAIAAGYVLNEFEFFEVVEINAKLVVGLVNRLLDKVRGLGLVVAVNLTRA
tara:strand:+ start:537 stop:788 length:252 start_codon:yes stop_codon:yes gene_type:complete